MSGDSLAFAPASELRHLIDSRQVSVEELTEMFLRRIEALNPYLNAYLTVTGDEALASARAADQRVLRGESGGPLHGIPVSIKDLELTRGIRSTMGSLIFKDHVPDHDSTAVERVRSAGAVILGKTNTPEFGASGTTENRLGEPCRNPWDTERTPGGSSGGAAAAVAAGMCTLAVGSDGGGSIRIPCSFCGVYGLKPTQGRVPRYGGVGKPGAYNTLSQTGPLTRTVRDSAVLLQALAGPDRRDAGATREEPPDFVAALEQDAKGLRIAWSPDLGRAAVDPEVAEAAARAARLFGDLGCTVEEPEITVEESFPLFYDIFSVVMYTSYGHLLEDRAEELTEVARNTLEYGGGVTGAEYSRALQRRVQLQAQMDDLFDDYDLLMTPSTAVTAFSIGQRPAVIAGRQVEPYWAYTPFTFLFNMTMQTAASIPCGFSSDGMPIGLHIVGRRGEETTVLRASAALERALPWADKRPPIS